MMKISALNEESCDDGEEEDVPSITKEAQEQIALTEYNKALELLKQDKQKEALNIFKDLLETELLDEVEKPEIPDGRSQPMLSLKYSCYKNIAAIEASWGNYEAAVQSYCKAGSLDDSDVMLWYRMGIIAMKISNLELACSSFKQGLRCNSNHWPCLDNIITALYAIPDYMSCLLYISVALERDPNYTKGLAFRRKIFQNIPCLQECYKLYNSDWELDPPLASEYNHEIGEKLLAEAQEVATRWTESCKVEFIPKPTVELTLRKPVAKLTWLSLGESLLDMHVYVKENDLSFVSRVKLVIEKAGAELSEKLEECKSEEEFVEKYNVGFNELSSLKTDDGDMDIQIKREETVDQSPQVTEENQLFSEALNAAMDVEIHKLRDVEDERKSCSTDIQVIDNEDTLRIFDSDTFHFDDYEVKKTKSTESDEQVTFEVEGSGEKSEIDKMKDEIYCTDNVVENEKSSDRDSDKSNDKVYEKADEKSLGTCKSSGKCDDKIDGKDQVHKVKKRRRSTLCLLQQWAWSYSSMRRSARVRSSTRRETERDDAQLDEELKRIFPSSLLPETVKLTKDDLSKSMEDSMSTMDLYQLYANQENNNITVTESAKSSDSSKSPSPEASRQQMYFGTELESADVSAFINEHSGRNNLMIIIGKFTECICMKWTQEWPEGLSEVYLQAYSFMREHIPHPSPFDEYTDDDILKLDAEMTLLFGELHTDFWLDKRVDVQPSSTFDRFGTGIPSEELGHIIFTSVRGDYSYEENLFILLRALWLKAIIFLCQGDMETVIETLELLLNQLRELESKNRNVCLVLPNCKYNSRISRRIVEKKLTSIQRSQKLGEIQYLYDRKKYAELAVILQDTFKFARQRHKHLSPTKSIVDRDQQLSMLLESLWQLQQYEECYIWAEACLNEAWQNYSNDCDEAEQKKWILSIVNALKKLEDCTNKVSVFVVKYLSESRLSRLVQNLVQIVHHQLDVPENAIEMPLETVLPWIILHYVLQYEEDKERAKSESPYKNKAHSSAQHSESDDEDDDIPASIMILFTAHKFIGRHSWCCFNEAKLLFFTMNLIIPKLETPQFSPIKNKLTKYLEQIFYCLYGHPSRMNKTRPKHLEEHDAPKMELTWEGAQLLFDFYKPKQMPLFESPRLASINTDTEILFKKIIKLVPQESDPNQIVEDMKAYIIDKKEKMPCVKKPLPYSISNIYYLLGDFYFKNNKWILAARYYLLDLCLHPSGLNSWAGLAMATGTEMGIELSSYEPIKEDKFLKKAKIAQSSYQRATELSPNHVIIWTEYGSFVYVVHSFCSRLLKQETDTLSMEKFEILENRKEEMLEIAQQCFQSSNRIFMACQGIDNMNNVQDERWLCQYMLGKIAEKRNQDPPIFLEHYSRASKLLHENNAQYPRRISHKNPQNLSIEALEVHYRIHASILKYLEQHEGKPLKKSLGQLFEWHLKNCSEGPFMKFQPKLLDKRKDNDSDGDVKSIPKDLDNFSDGTDKNVVTVCQRSNSIEEIEIIDRRQQDKDSISLGRMVDSQKAETRKRSPDQQFNDNTKRLKLGNVSHLQLMQDVLALIDDLITKVCDVVAQQKENRSLDDMAITSGDESNEFKWQKKKNESSNGMDSSKGHLKIEKSRRSTLSIKTSGNVFESCGKGENVQDLMDALMKQAMEMSQESQQSLADDEDTRKSEGKWLQSEDLQLVEKDAKDKNTEKRKSHVSTPKQEATLSRRGSQESTTTTQTTSTTETNNSSSSSSEESSSSEDSSESDTSSDSDSDSVESDNDKKKRDTDLTDKEEYLSDEEVATLVAYCLAGLEQCILRFNEHHKSFYRLAHYFFNSRTAKDISKCKDILLGTYNCQFYPGQNFQGLFAERKANNFFNGIWHIPNEEIDRPGSFASHMSKCITLLMQVLKETNDSRMLMQLGIQLGKETEPDKKYLRDSEREQLSRQAMTLCLQSLRSRINTMGVPNSTDSNVHVVRTDARTQVLLDVYKIYRQVQKHFQGKESTVQAFASLLSDTYKTYIGNKALDGNVLEVAIKYCHRQITANKTALTNNNSCSVNSQIANASVNLTTQPLTQVSQSSSSQSSQSRKLYKSLTSTGRPRGRPPNVNKYLHFNSKNSFTNYLGTTGNRTLMNPYFMNPLIDPNVLPAILASSLGGNMMDSISAMNYFNQLGSYQDILRQYQSNLSSLSNLTGGLNVTTSATPNISSIQTTTASTPVSINTSTSVGNLPNLSALMAQQLLASSSSSAVVTSRATPMYHQTTTSTKPMTAPPTTTSASLVTKDRPNISITPVVNTQLPSKSKSNRQSPQATDALPVHIPKSFQISQTSKPVSHTSSSQQVSLLKASIGQVKNSPPKQISAPQIRVSKSLTEPQPAHNSSLCHPTLKNAISSNTSTVPQVAHPSIPSSMNMKPSVPINVPTSTSSKGTSLQHKLLSKKNSQRTYSHMNAQNPMRKQKVVGKSMPIMTNNLTNMINPISSASTIGQTPYMSTDLSGISVSPISQNSVKGSGVKLSGYKKPSVKPKTIAESSGSSLTNSMPNSMPSSIPSSMSLTSVFPQTTSAEALSMLSQLQQHSHLEIIPQQKSQTKGNIDFGKSLSSSMNVTSQKNVDVLRHQTSECMSTFYDLQRGKAPNVSSKKADRSGNDSVEIITLDD